MRIRLKKKKKNYKRNQRRRRSSWTKKELRKSKIWSKTRSRTSSHKLLSKSSCWWLILAIIIKTALVSVSIATTQRRWSIDRSPVMAVANIQLSESDTNALFAETLISVKIVKLPNSTTILSSNMWSLNLNSANHFLRCHIHYYWNQVSKYNNNSSSRNLRNFSMFSQLSR